MIKLSKDQKIQSTFIEYTLIKEIGSGGNGHVWEARDINGKAFAIKFLSPENYGNTEKYNRFRNEVAFSLFNNHENLIQICDTGSTVIKNRDNEEIRIPFSVMSKAMCSLRDFINDKTKCTNETKFQLVTDIINGLVFLHERNIIHRDLKPENILVYEENGFKAVIADLGIAHFRKYPAVENITSKNDRMGNRDYAAPEQRQKPYNACYASDIFSLGLIIHELFTGELAHGIRSKKIESSAPRYSFLDEIVDKSISDTSEMRFQNAIELKKQFDSLRDNIHHYISEYRQQPVHFHNDRLLYAFPQARGGYDTTDSRVIIKKLSILLRKPYIINGFVCVAMLCGTQNYIPDIQHFKVIDDTTVLIECFECKISKLHAFSDSLDYHSYTYIEVDPLPPVNLDNIENSGIHDEEYALYNGKIITLGEREAGVIEKTDGTTEKINSCNIETRIRPLKKTNWIIFSPAHPANTPRYEASVRQLMSEILSGTKTTKELDSFVSKLQKPDFYR